MKFRNPFKKKENPVVEVKEEEEKGISYTDFLIAIGRKVGKEMSQMEISERFSKNFAAFAINSGL